MQVRRRGGDPTSGLARATGAVAARRFGGARRGRSDRLEAMSPRAKRPERAACASGLSRLQRGRGERERSADTLVDAGRAAAHAESRVASSRRGQEDALMLGAGAQWPDAGRTRVGSWAARIEVRWAEEAAGLAETERPLGQEVGSGLASRDETVLDPSLRLRVAGVPCAARIVGSALPRRAQCRSVIHSQAR